MPGHHAARRGNLLAAGILVALALAVFLQTLSFDFVHFDDDVYVTGNPRVARGLTAEGLRWAFTTTHGGFWLPLTWLSLMVDAELFGLHAGGFHGTNLLLHLLNTLLLFHVLRRMTGAAARSLVAAALFAVHPVHVESVAWVTERKDLLFCAFGLLAVGFHLRYARRPEPWRLLPVCLAFAASLMAKQMLVTLPLLLLLLDWWPLGRLGLRGSPAGAGRVSLPGLLLEKLPLFALAAAAGVGAFLAQRSWGAISSAETVPAALRLANALVGYASYLAKALWPARLSAIYLLPDGGHPVSAVAAAGTLLAAVSAGVAFARRPAVTVGWLWFLGTLAPVVGLVQIGLHFMADRFMYLPIAGIMLAAAWTCGDVLGRRSPRTTAAAAAVAIATLAALAAVQTRTWRNTGTLFGHALRMDPGNWVARYALGNALLEQGRPAEAAEQYREGLRLHPNFRRGRNNLGKALLEQGRFEEAAEQFRLAVLAKPDDPLPHANLGTALARLGRDADAARAFGQAIALDGANAAAYQNQWALALAAAGEKSAAVARLREAVRLDPASERYLNNLGSLLAEEGRLDEARALFLEALRINPGFDPARANLARLERQSGAGAR